MCFEVGGSGVGSVEVSSDGVDLFLCPRLVGELGFELFDAGVSGVEVCLLFLGERHVAVRHDGLRLWDPFVTVDAAREGVECVVDGCLVFVGERCDLFPGLYAKAVEYAFKLWSDTLDDLEVVDVIDFNTGGTELGFPDLPSSGLPCSHAHGVLIAEGLILIGTVESCFELRNPCVLRIEVTLEALGCCQLCFKISGTGLFGVEVSLSCERSAKFTLEFGDASIACANGVLFGSKL